MRYKDKISIITNVAEHSKPLTAKQELYLSSQLHRLKTKCWQLLITHKPARAYVIKVVLAGLTKYNQKQHKYPLLSMEKLAELQEQLMRRRLKNQVFSIQVLDWDNIWWRKCYAKLVRTNPSPELLQKIQELQGKLHNIRAQFFQSNVGLAIKIAKKHLNLYSRLAFPDLVQESYLNLWRNIDRYNPKFGKFTTFIYMWLDQAVGRAQKETGKIVRLPEHAYYKKYKIVQATAKMTEELGRKPTTEELAQVLGYDVKTVLVLQLTPVEIFIDDSDHSDDNEPRKTHSLTVLTPSPENLTTVQNAQDIVQNLVAKLGPRHRGIIQARFGLNGWEEVTLAEIGRHQKCSRENIRLLEESALKRLRKECLIQKYSPEILEIYEHRSFGSGVLL